MCSVMCLSTNILTQHFVMAVMAFNCRGMPPMPVSVGMMPPAASNSSIQPPAPPPPSSQTVTSTPQTNPGQLLFPAAAALVQVCTIWWL